MTSLVTDKGIANAIAALNAYASRARYLGWGVGSGQGASATDLASKTGVTEARVEGTTSIQETNVAGDTYQVVGTITAAGALAITELGVFDEAGAGTPPSGGNMCIYGDFSAINVVAGNTITFTVQAQLDQA